MPAYENKPQAARRLVVGRFPPKGGLVVGEIDRRHGLITRLGCHTFRVTGITVYLLNGGLLEYAQQMADG